MKNLRQINLIDSYINPAKVRFFTTDWTPNGTSTLIVVDDMGQIIGSIDEALFGPTLDHKGHGETFGQVHYWNGESVWIVDDQDDFNKGDILFPLKLDQVLDSIAESPVKSRFSVLRELVTLIKEGV